jgi:hypothetical protein
MPPSKLPPEVTVIRSGYASEPLWVTAITQALQHGRTVAAIDAQGQIVSEADLARLGVPEPVPEKSNVLPFRKRRR